MKMIADANLLLRFVLEDDPQQFKLALDAVERAESVVVTSLALCEMVWVLRSRYGVSRAAIAATIHQMRQTRNFVVDSTAAEAGLAMLQAGADFADGVIGYEGRWLGGDTFVSFDKKAVTAFAKQGLNAKLLA